MIMHQYYNKGKATTFRLSSFKDKLKNDDTQQFKNTETTRVIRESKFQLGTTQ